MDINFYTIGCPACNVLKAKLDSKSVKYNTVTDKETMINMGINSLPVLEVDGKLMSFYDAVKWINALGE